MELSPKRRGRRKLSKGLARKASITLSTDEPAKFKPLPLAIMAGTGLATVASAAYLASTGSPAWALTVKVSSILFAAAFAILNATTKTKDSETQKLTRVGKVYTFGLVISAIIASTSLIADYNRDLRASADRKESDEATRQLDEVRQIYATRAVQRSAKQINRLEGLVVFQLDRRNPFVEEYEQRLHLLVAKSVPNHSLKIGPNSPLFPSSDGENEQYLRKTLLDTKRRIIVRQAAPLVMSEAKSEGRQKLVVLSNGKTFPSKRVAMLRSAVPRKRKFIREKAGAPLIDRLGYPGFIRYYPSERLVIWVECVTNVVAEELENDILSEYDFDKGILWYEFAPADSLVLDVCAARYFWLETDEGRWKEGFCQEPFTSPLSDRQPRLTFRGHPFLLDNTRPWAATSKPPTQLNQLVSESSDLKPWWPVSEARLSDIQRTQDMGQILRAWTQKGLETQDAN